jgi:hypothetical protein
MQAAQTQYFTPTQLSQATQLLAPVRKPYANHNNIPKRSPKSPNRYRPKISFTQSQVKKLALMLQAGSVTF